MEASSPLEGEPERLNCFALVSYIRGQLGFFLDQIRRDLEPNTLAPRAHITLLPPRPLADSVTASAARSYLDKALADLSPVEIRVGPIEIFPGTNVVYASVEQGFDKLQRLHREFNRGPLSFRENFDYHPHITLAQNLTLPEAEAVRDQAARRWKQYGGVRHFSTESFTFVQANRENRWVDLAEYSLVSAGR